MKWELWTSRAKLIQALPLLLLAACLAATPAAIVPAAIRVQGAVPKPREWTADQLHQTPAAEIHSIQYANRGQKHSAHGIALLAVLKAAGADTELKMDPKADPREKNHPLRLTVIVRGNDGYTAAFSLAELLPDIGNRDAWVIFDSDDKPFAEGEGHMRLIVPADQKPGRWVRDVVSVIILDSGKDVTAADPKP